jgi:alpha-glucosidase
VTATAGRGRWATSERATAQSAPWWSGAAIYQVYLRSFADGNGDGVGDLAGCRSRLSYLADLGVDAIWFNPWYLSPMADGGYDVADYRQIDPQFGSLSDAESLITEAHALDIRVVLDIVPNHCSDRHPWFVSALSSAPGSAERQRFYFRPGRGPGGELPPNDWQSEFGGSAWARTTGPDGLSAEWYLHLFAPEQPDFNWEDPAVRAEFEAVLRFWFDRGVDGFRVDSAALVAKDPGLSDIGARPGSYAPGQHPFLDRDEVHAIYRSWRRIADSYPDKRALIGEVWLPDRERFALYLRDDEFHSAFNFDFLCCALEAPALRRVIDDTLASHARLGATTTWVLSNHDVVRHVTRYGRAETAFKMDDRRIGDISDIELGTRRARAATLLSLSLPGTAYIYQGDELGLWEVEDLPEELLQDPFWQRSGKTDRGRDGCRVPMPWSGQAPPFGFTDDATSPWLPQPSDWKALTVEAERSDPASMLALYRAALAIRRQEPSLRSRVFAWEDAPDGVLCYSRGENVVVLVNLSAGPVALPEHEEILLASGPLSGPRPPDGNNLAGNGGRDGGVGRVVPSVTAVWLRRG